MCKIIEDMRNKAELKGKTEGINILAKLMQKLFAMGRLEDAERVASDSEYREKLLKEFSLIKNVNMNMELSFTVKADPFYCEEKQSRLRESIAQAKSGRVHSHDLIED